MIPILNQTSWPSMEHFSSHTSVGWAFCGQWCMFSFRAVKVYGLAVHFGLHTHLRIWYCEGSCVWYCFHPRHPLLGLWQYLIRLQVCLLSCDSTECQVREQKHSLKAKSLETFMGTIQGCPALEDPPESVPDSTSSNPSRPSLKSSVLKLTGRNHLTTISQNIQILVGWARYSRRMTLEHAQLKSFFLQNIYFLFLCYLSVFVFCFSCLLCKRCSESAELNVDKINQELSRMIVYLFGSREAMFGQR